MKDKLSTSNLPCDTGMEDFLLSAMLINDGEIIPYVANILTAEDFFRPNNKIIFKAFVSIFNDNLPVTFLTLSQYLKNFGVLGKEISYTELFNLDQLSYTTANYKYYAKQIKELSNRRKIIQAANDFAHQAQTGNVDNSTLLDNLNRTIGEIKSTEQEFMSGKKYLTDRFSSYLDYIRQFISRKTGFDNIDAEQVFAPGLYVLGATPAAGKTTFAWQMIDQLAERGETCIYCSYEMSQPRLYEKSFARAMFNINPFTTVTSTSIERGGWTDELLYTLSERIEIFGRIYVLELQTETIDELLRKLRHFCRKSERPPIICIDYLQIIPHGKDSTKTGIDDMVRKLKVFQRDTNTTFIVVSSFNRTNYLQQVSFESFKESGNIEYTADVVWAMQLSVVNLFKGGMDPSGARLKIEEAKKSKPRQVQLKCLKNRLGNNYDCYFEYFAANDCFVPCDNFEPANNASSANNFEDN